MVACYGWRGADPRVQYLSPWEFHMGWRPVRLEPPHLYYPDSTRLTNWIEKGMERMLEASDDEKPWYELGVDFVIVEEFPSVHSVSRREYLAFLEIGVGPHTQSFTVFRSTWVLQRRFRPSVPCPIAIGWD